VGIITSGCKRIAKKSCQHQHLKGGESREGEALRCQKVEYCLLKPVDALKNWGSRKSTAARFTKKRAAALPSKL